MKSIRRASFIFVFLPLILSCTTNRLTGRAVKVQDGDTFTLLTNTNNRIKIRLYGIDAPEKGQDFNRKSKAYLSDLIADRHVTVEYKGIDPYKRVLGIVYVNRLNVNEEMLRRGLAWRYKYNEDERYLELQEEAGKKKLNIWSTKNPVDPWQWRKNLKKKK
jgi:endonuclease YncB( thermonuclease family)